MTMTCEELRESYELYALGVLDGEEKSEIDAHLGRGCPACRKNLNDALAAPMADVFNTAPANWSFTATPSAYLYNTSLPLPAKAAGLVVPKSTHDAKYWARVTRGLDFSDADQVDPVLYNRILWKGMMASRPYPAALRASNLRRHRPDRDDDDRPSPQQKNTPASKPDSD